MTGSARSYLDRPVARTPNAAEQSVNERRNPWNLPEGVLRATQERGSAPCAANRGEIIAAGAAEQVLIGSPALVSNTEHPVRAHFHRAAFFKRFVPCKIPRNAPISLVLFSTPRIFTLRVQLLISNSQNSVGKAQSYLTFSLGPLTFDFEPANSKSNFISRTTHHPFERSNYGEVRLFLRRR